MVDRMPSHVRGDALNPLLVGTSASVCSVRIRTHHALFRPRSAVPATLSLPALVEVHIDQLLT